MCVSGGEDTQGVGASAGHVAWELSSSEENILFLVCFIFFYFWFVVLVPFIKDRRGL